MPRYLKMPKLQQVLSPCWRGAGAIAGSKPRPGCAARPTIHAGSGELAPGQGATFLLTFRDGDIVAACLKRRGFVGIGRAVERAQPIRHVIVRGRPRPA